MPVFSLKEAKELQIKNVSEGNFKYWPEGATYGYFAGGYNPSGIRLCTIYRLDFSSETISAPGKNLPSTAEYPGSIVNNFYGYFAGGFSATYLATTTRLDLSNETISLPGKNLPFARTGATGTSGALYGYFGGGSFNQPPIVQICQIVRLDFSSETLSDPGKTLSGQVTGSATCSNNSYGYFGGGFNYNARIDRLDFLTEVVSARSPLPQNRYEHSATSNSSFGYYSGGTTATSVANSLVLRLDFSTENTITTSSVLYSSAASYNTSCGYYANRNLIHRFDFSTESVNTPPTFFPEIIYYQTGFSAGQSVFRPQGGGTKTYGYMIGGFSPSYVSTVSRIDFSSENISNPGKNLPATRGNFSGAVSSNYYGYFGGGYDAVGSTRICTITRLDFSNEIISNPGKNLPTVNSTCGGVSSNNYGYFGGGYRYSFPLSVPALRLCTITRLDFSTENVNNITSTLLGFGIDSMATVMNNSYGYFGGGLTVAPFTSVSNITRLDFSNETTSAPATKLPANNFELAALSSSSYGYFGGGLTPPGSPGAAAINTITRLDFSNDTLSPPGKNLPTAIYRQSTVSNNFYGYFIGGWFPVVNTVSRIDFSNETVSLPGKNIPSASSEIASVVSISYGYFGGGRSPATPTSILTNIIRRLDFSNETISLPGKNILVARADSAGTSSSLYGYFGGGFGPFFVSTITRLDFSSETVSDPGKNFSTTIARRATTSNSSYGYFGGGSVPGVGSVCTITRFDFSNETVSDSGNNLPSALDWLSATTSTSYGYFGGGYAPPATYVCTISRLDFSNETVSAPNKNLLSSKNWMSATSSNTYGYYGGGYFTPLPSFICTITRLDFSSETVSDPGQNLPSVTGRFAAISGGQSIFRPIGGGSKTYGYFGGGYGGSTISYSTISRFNYSNESINLPGNNLPSSRSGVFSVSSNYYGYFGGGYTPATPPTPNPVFSTIVRLDFSNETVSNPGKNLSQSRCIAASFSSSSYGYFFSGYLGTSPSTTATTSVVSRLDFSNETVSDPGKNSSNALFSNTGISNNFYGYSVGGSTIINHSTTQRLDFLTETVTRIPNLNLPTSGLPSAGRSYLSGISNNSYGYVAGGRIYTPPTYTYINVITRLDFSSETVSDPGKNLPQTKINSGNLSNNFYGYFAGGEIPTLTNVITRIDLSNENINDLANGLPLSYSGQGSFSNSN